jgi:hypothetical protein
LCYPLEGIFNDPPPALDSNANAGTPDRGEKMKNSIFLSVFALLVALGCLTISSVQFAQEIQDPAAESGLNDDPASPEVSTTLVISQVYGGGGANSGSATYTRDYVELKNISNTPQSLSGLSIYYGSATGQFASSAGNAFALPAVTLAPGQYFLVEVGSTGTVGAPLPVTADASSTTMNLSGASGKVALVNGLPQNTCGATATPCPLPNPQIIDLVSYGASNNAEGGAPANGGTALTSTQGVVRKNNGCQDSDNNNADFDVVTNPVPRNSSSPATACFGTVGTRRPPADFSGDRKTDWAVVRFNPSNFTLSWFVKNNDATGAEFGFPWGVATDLVVPADYDGDGREDVAVWRGAFGEGRTGFYIVRSRDLTTQFVPFGIESDDPSVTYDYTGDGRADPAIYRRGAVRNTFWFLASSGAVQGRHVPVQWGAGDVKAIVGDYTGDGIGDFTVVRAAAAGRGPDTVFIHPGTGGVDAPGADFFYNWGLRNFVWVPGDYDGDGRTDAAAIQTLPNGQMVWHFRPSTVNNDANFVSVPWGVSSDDPAPGDYDGDGRMDFAIFRNGQFFVLTQSGGQIFFPWGQTGDKPVQVIFPE